MWAFESEKIMCSCGQKVDDRCYMGIDQSWSLPASIMPPSHYWLCHYCNYELNYRGLAVPVSAICKVLNVTDHQSFSQQHRLEKTNNLPQFLGGPVKISYIYCVNYFSNSKEYPAKQKCHKGKEPRLIIHTLLSCMDYKMDINISLSRLCQFITTPLVCKPLAPYTVAVRCF